MSPGWPQGGPKERPTIRTRFGFESDPRKLPKKGPPNRAPRRRTLEPWIAKKEPWLQPGTLFQRSPLRDKIGSRLHFGALWGPQGRAKIDQKVGPKTDPEREPLKIALDASDQRRSAVGGRSAGGRREVDGRLAPAVWKSKAGRGGKEGHPPGWRVEALFRLSDTPWAKGPANSYGRCSRKS